MIQVICLAYSKHSTSDDLFPECFWRYLHTLESVTYSPACIVRRN